MDLGEALAQWHELNGAPDLNSRQGRLDYDVQRAKDLMGQNGPTQEELNTVIEQLESPNQLLRNQAWGKVGEWRIRGLIEWTS